jgi:hypothetical protein
VTLEDAIPIFADSAPGDWTAAHTDLDTGSSSSLYVPDRSLSIVSHFLRPRDHSDELGEPWVVHGHPIAWRGSVQVLSGVVELVEVPGFSVRASARVPEPDSTDDRSVAAWKIGLFRLSSLLEYDTNARASYGQTQFDAALSELRITPRE